MRLKVVFAGVWEARLDEVGLNEVARGWVVGGREGFLVESILKNHWILILYTSSITCIRTSR
jgi:hypothetical protein